MLQALSEKATFVDHTWLADGQLVVALSTRRLLILEGVHVCAAVYIRQVRISDVPVLLWLLRCSSVLHPHFFNL